MQLEAGGGHRGWRADVQVLNTLGQLGNHPVDLQGTRAESLVTRLPKLLLRERVKGWQELHDA